MDRPAPGYLMDLARVCGSQAAVTGIILDDPVAMARARALLEQLGGIDVHRLMDSEVLARLAELPACIAPSPQSVASLGFNGSRLCWLADGAVVVCWNAVSGRAGHQGSDHQREAGSGPIPAGRWRVRQESYQAMRPRSMLEALWNELGRGQWPGGESSWGRHRVWLDPMEGTETYGRSGFSIHGGSDAGSGGCIDLTGNMEAFVERFLEYGRDMTLTVDYTGQ